MKKVLSMILSLALVLTLFALPTFAADEDIFVAYDAFELKNGSTPWNFQRAAVGRNDYQDLSFFEVGWYHEFYQNWSYGAWNSAAQGNWVRVHPGMSGDAALCFTVPRDGNIQIPSFQIFHTYENGDGTRFQVLKNDMVIYPENEDWFIPETTVYDLKTPDIFLTAKQGDKIYLRFNAGENQSSDTTVTVNYQIRYLSEEAYAKGVTRKGAVVVNKEPLTKTKIEVNFTDVNNHWGKDYIIPLAEKGIIKGKSATTFEPDSNITRAEFLTLALNVGGITATAGEAYADVAADAWFANTVATAKSLGLVDANMTLDGNFYPDRNITREEMTSVIIKLYESKKGAAAAGDVAGFSDNASFSAWTRDSISKAVALGVVTGNPDGTFNALGNATRAEAAVIFSRLLEKL